jgi:pilus assembly protein CpaE
MQNRESNAYMIPISSKDPDGLGTKVLFVGLIGPDEPRRRGIANALSELRGSVTQEYSAYPDLDDVPRLVEANYDVVIVELDTNPEHALDIVEGICGGGSATVMVYSEQVFPEMLVRCMRAGAREFLTPPITPSSIAEALVRASVRRPTTPTVRKALGKLLVFVGAKGGSGVTTIASNYAVSLARESGQNTMLIDLNLPLGDAALELGVNAQYSTENAIQNFARLDSNFLSKLLVKHSSGLSVLAAPDSYTELHSSHEAIEKLLAVARQDFDFVVVDAGSRFDSTCKALFEPGAVVYLVLQVGISELRNANRLVSELFKSSGAKLEIVLNRYSPRVLGIDEDSITKALTRPPTWKIPNDYSTARNSKDAASPLALKDSPISRVIRQMTKSIYGGTADIKDKKKFGLFG